jgi:hypothetical protein
VKSVKFHPPLQRFPLLRAPAGFAIDPTSPKILQWFFTDFTDFTVGKASVWLLRTKRTCMRANLTALFPWPN